MYGVRLFIALSVLLNVILGGYSNQTFSARNYCWKKKGLPNLVFFIDRICFFDPGHCKKSYEFWLKLKETHSDLRMFR